MGSPHSARLTAGLRHVGWYFCASALAPVAASFHASAAPILAPKSSISLLSTEGLGVGSGERSSTLRREGELLGPESELLSC